MDPFLLPLSNLYVALYHGCQLEKQCRVIAVTKEQRNGEKYWKVKAEKRDGGKSGVNFFRAAKVINCGGNYSDELDHLVPRTIDEAKPFNIQPGRGEYVVLAKDSKTAKKGPQRMVTQVPTKTYQEYITLCSKKYRSSKFKPQGIFSAPYNYGANRPNLLIEKNAFIILLGT